MASIQIGNGWFNPQNGKYTTYDPNTGQLYTRMLNPGFNVNDPKVIQGLQNGTINLNDAFKDVGNNNLGGRANVNVQSQVNRAYDMLSQQYPQISSQDIARYANQWVSDRIAAGWDANEVENMMKDVTRNPNSMNNDFLNGVTGMISDDAAKARNSGATGAGDAAANNPRGSIQDELRAFAGRMMSVLPPDSPQVQRIAELAQQAGNKYATQSGLGPGGITAMGVANTAARANTDLQLQREGIGANALAAAGNQQLSVDALNTQLQQGNQQANTMQGSNIGGLIGSGAGLIGGIVASAYGGGAALPGLVQGGGAAGQTIGGTVANGAQGPIRYGGQSGAPTSTFKGRSWGTS